MGVFLGVLGQLAAADTIRRNSTRVSQALRARGIDLAGRLRTGLLREIGSESAPLSEYSDANVVAKARQADDFSLLKAEADALLDITVSEMGFYSSSGMDDYTPQVYVTMGLRSPGSSEWLGDASYAYDRSPSKGYQRHFQTAPEFKFADVETLVADGARAARALEVAMDSIAGAIAVDVRTVLAGKFLT
jgi:hypothetical protein